MNPENSWDWHISINGKLRPVFRGKMKAEITRHPQQVRKTKARIWRMTFEIESATTRWHFAILGLCVEDKNLIPEDIEDLQIRPGGSCVRFKNGREFKGPQFAPGRSERLTAEERIANQMELDSAHREAADNVERRALEDKAARTDEEQQRFALELLEKMGAPDCILIYQAYANGLSMDGIASKFHISKSTVQRRLKKAEKQTGLTIIRKPGGAAHTGDIFRQRGRKRNIRHTGR